MRALAAVDILELWENAQHCHPVDQGVALLMAAEPECSRDDVAGLPLGRRDDGLLALHQATFGDILSGCSDCPQCHATAEFDIACSALRASAGELQERTLQTDGYWLRVRPLDSFDLAAAAGAGSLSAARAILLRRCAMEVRHGDAVVATEALPERVTAVVAATVLAADPQAELLLELACPECEHRWRAPLDMVCFLWSEVAARAQHLLMEVHLLARAYGWHEADILGMPAARRAAYLQMVTL